MATGDLHTKFREDLSSSSRDMLADKYTQTDRCTDRRVDHNTPHRYQGGVIALLTFRSQFSFTAMLHGFRS